MLDGLVLKKYESTKMIICTSLRLRLSRGLTFFAKLDNYFELNKFFGE